MPPKRNAFTEDKKAALRRHHRENPELPQRELSAWFEAQYGTPIKQGTVSEVLSSRYSHLDDDELVRSDRKKQRTEAYPDLEQSLAAFIKSDHETPPSGEKIRTKAREYWTTWPQYRDLPEPSFSSGWLSNFCKRHKISLRPRLVEDDTHGDLKLAADRALLQAKVAQYALGDRYTCGETGLFWKLIPDPQLDHNNFDDDSRLKLRVTLHQCCSATGAKLPLWVVGRYHRPRAFQASGIHAENLGVTYRVNDQASMDKHIVVEWLMWFDQLMAGRKVILLLDDLTAHVAGLKELRQLSPPYVLQNTEVCFVPWSLRSYIQPLQRGITTTFKAHYRYQWAEYYAEQHSLGINGYHNTNILKAIRWSVRAWNQVNEQTIAECWSGSYANLRPQLPAPNNDELTSAIEDLTRLLQQCYQNHVLPRTPTDALLLCQDPHEEISDKGDAMAKELARLHGPAGAQEPEEDQIIEIEHLPQVSTAQALHALHQLRTYEEQSHGCNAERLDFLDRFERDVKSRHVQSDAAADLVLYEGLSALV